MKKARLPLTLVGMVQTKTKGVKLETPEGELIAFAPRLWHQFVRHRRVG